jgi:hypothetical protein
MINLFRRSISKPFGVVLLVMAACSSSPEQPSGRSSSTPHQGIPPGGGSGSRVSSRQAAPTEAGENPFTRRTFAEHKTECVSMSLQSQGDRISQVRLANRCNHPVAVLTAPLELRVRRTGKEKFIYERTSWAAYAILYALATNLGDQAFRGDGVIRDGGLRLNRGPGYTAIGPKTTATVPLRCPTDLPPGRYGFLLSTFEVLLHDAPRRNDPFDCTLSVDRWNGGMGVSTFLFLNEEVGQLQGSSTTVTVVGTGR